MNQLDTLYILWTTRDAITAEYMLMLYATNAQKKQWFDQVHIIIWGASAKLIAENKHIQDLILDAQKAGVIFQGCIHCATSLDVVNILERLNITLLPAGIPLTEIIKNQKYLITI